MLKNIFLTGMMANSAIIKTVIGRSVTTSELTQIRILGWQVFRTDTGLDALHPAAHESGVEGVVLSVNQAERERLEFFLSAASGRWAKAQFGDSGEGCFIWRADPQAYELSQGPVSRVKDMQVAAAGLMELFGFISYEDVHIRLKMLIALAGRTYRAPSDTVMDEVPDMGLSDVQVCSHSRRHDGFYALDEVALRHRRYDGGMTSVLHREVLVSIDAAILLPYDPVRDRVLLLEQFRPGPLLHSDPAPWIMEPVAGRIDRGETAEQAARREAREEAGLELHALEWVGTSYPSPGLTNERYHCYVGLCDLPEFKSGYGGLPEEGEDIKSHVISFERLINMADCGTIKAGPLMICALWLARHRDRLRAGA